MPSASDPRLDQVKFWAMYSKLAQTQTGTLVNTYRYHDVKRLIHVDEEDIEAKGSDKLAKRLVDGVKALPTAGRGRDSEIDPPASLAILFQEISLARSLKPKLWLAFDLRDDKAAVCGLLTGSDFLRDDGLSTSKFTQSYLTQHQLPRFDANWTLVDVVASSKRGTGALLLLQCIIASARAKKTGILSIAVTAAGKGLFQACGFDTSHSFKDKGGTRTLAFARMGDIHLGKLHTRLRVHTSLLEETCLREGLTPASADRLIPRC